MTARFNPNTNPYADEILRLVHVPKSRFTTLEKMTSAAIHGAKLYGLEIWEQPRMFWRWPHGNLFTIPHGSNSPVWVEVLFETEKYEVTERLRDLKTIWSDWLGDEFERIQLIALKAGNNGLIELYNGQWWGHDSLALIASRFAQDTVSDLEQSSSDPIPLRTDEESSAAYFGRSSIQGGGGGRDGGFGGGGGDGGSGGGDGPQGQAPGAGGVREMLNHPVLFSADKETLRAILENT